MLFCSGCIWGTVAIVGIAVVGANVNEYQESQVACNATKDLDEHLEQRRKENEAVKRSEKFPSERIDADEVIETYTNTEIVD